MAHDSKKKARPNDALYDPELYQRIAVYSCNVLNLYGWDIEERENPRVMVVVVHDVVRSLGMPRPDPEQTVGLIRRAQEWLHTKKRDTEERMRRSDRKTFCNDDDKYTDYVIHNTLGTDGGGGEIPKEPYPVLDAGLPIERYMEAAGCMVSD